MIKLGPMAHFIVASFTIVLLLDRRALGAETPSKHSPSSPWLPSGPPPKKTSSDTSDSLKTVLPLITFDCRGKKGYFPDSKFNCEIFHYCKSDGTRNTFTCPSRSIFNQLSMVCEEKTSFNSRICKEGSIGMKRDGPKKNIKHLSKPAFSSKKYTEDLTKQHRMSPSSLKRPDLSLTTPGYVVSLEELLSYMNSEQYAKKTFDPNDQVVDSEASGDLVNPSISISKQTTLQTKFTTTSVPFESVKIAEKPTVRKFSKVLSNVSVTAVDKDIMHASESRVIDDYSKEYDAIEGRRPRKHKRVGKVLDVKDVPRKRSHVSARSPTDSPPQEEVITSTTTESSINGTLPSLFSADRSKARDFRKKRRNLNRRRKTQKDHNLPTTTDVPTTIQDIQTERHDSAELAAHSYEKQKKTLTNTEHHFDEELSLSWLGMTNSGKVEPYTLPPLPIPEDDRMAFTTEKFESATQLKKRRNKIRRPLHSTTPTPNEDMMMEMKFGEKISELSHHQYGTDQKLNRTDNTEMPAYEDIGTEDFRESNTQMKPKSETKAVVNSSKQRGTKKYIDNDERFYHHPLTLENKKPLPKSIEDLFPPPRAESRDQKSVDPQQIIYDVNSDKQPFEYDEATTDDPPKTTYSYVGKHRSRTRGQSETDRLKWRLSEDKRKKKEKIEVGSTFAMHSPESTSRPRLQVPPTEEPFETESIKSKKELPKGVTSAHKHLLKLMNDFFAKSSSDDTPERQTGDFTDREENMATPNYTESEEDMHRGESTTEEMEEFPPELLDVMDFIAEQSEEEKRDMKNEDSHEIIKISGPITNKHLKEIFSDRIFDNRKKLRNDSEKKIVVVPSNDKENLKDFAEVAQFASVRLGPLLKKMASEKTSVTVIPMKTETEKQRKSAVMSAKKIPVRVFYKEQASGSTAHRATTKPSLKVVRSRLPNPSLQVIHNGRLSPLRTYSQPHYKPKKPHHTSNRPVILHPKSVYPPHPPPLPKQNIPFKFGFPFVGTRPFTNNMGYISHRKKRSILNRDRRQIRHTLPLLPFPRPLMPPFNPKFPPNFSPFKNVLGPNVLSTAASNSNPFTFPKFDNRKPSYGEPSIFKLPNSPPAPVRHITQAGDQTVIVEEVPVPIHVEVSDPNMFRPVHTGNHHQNLVNPFSSSNQFRNPSPPAIQTPPLMQGFQGSFPVNYRAFGMPSNIRAPSMNYQPSLFSPPLPPTITNQGQLYALGVTTKPFQPSKPPPSRTPNGIIGAPPGPPQQFQVHVNSYPNYPYFQNSFTTPITNEPVPGRVMYSGYKPPKSTTGTKLPRTTRIPNRERKVKPENNHYRTPSRSRPSQSYYVTKNPTQEYNNYKAPNTRGRSQVKYVVDAQKETSESISPKPNSNNGSPPVSENPVPRRRLNKKRRPRPNMTSTTPYAHIYKDISPTPPPAEQIPPPLADFTSLPLQQEKTNSPQNNKDTTEATENSNPYPPAGYYGKDQLVQFFDSSAKSYKKASTVKPYEHNDLGENTSSAELDEAVTSLSSDEDPDQPAFGTRLKTKSEGQRRKKKRQPIQSPTQKTEVRTRPSNSPNETDNRKRQSEYVNRTPARNHQGRDGNSNGQRRPQYRARSRPTSMPSRGAEVHPFKQDRGNIGGFYSVPSGLETLVDPSHRPSQNQGHTDMFGIPHSSFNSNFFSVPAEVAQQQKSSLHNMNTRPIPESAREFFEAAAKESSNYKKAETSEKEQEEQNAGTDAGEEKRQKINPQVVRKLRKPKRKNRYNPRTNEEKATSDLPSSDQTQINIAQQNVSNKDRTTTPAVTTTTELYPIYVPTESMNSQNDIKEQQTVFKPRAPLLPKALPEISKLQNGKIDFKKLNATISTSVSVSGAFPQQLSNDSSEDNSKKVFSSQNGGLAVVRSNPKRKRTRQKLDRYGSDEESSTKTKYDIAASVLDIIKATAETEKLGGAGFYSNRYRAVPNASASSTSNVWNNDPAKIDYNRTLST